MKQTYSGLYYANGTCVNYLDNGGRSIADSDRRNHEKKTFRMGFRQRMKIYDAITIQNDQSNRANQMFHSFLTLTFRQNKIPDKPNQAIGYFFDRMKKAGYINYCWTREIGANGLLHYHYTTVGPYRPIHRINDIWCQVRGDYSRNAVRSSVNPYTGRAQMIIKKLSNARHYVAKYMAKGVDRELSLDSPGYPGRIWACSHDLKAEPVKVPDATGYAIHPWYGDKQANLFKPEEGHCTIGRVRPELALDLWGKLRKFYKEPEPEPTDRNQLPIRFSNRDQLHLFEG